MGCVAPGEKTPRTYGTFEVMERCAQSVYVVGAEGAFTPASASRKASCVQD
jgi:hypothetical protein